jgi:AcrR family transcriptional regulator
MVQKKLGGLRAKRREGTIDGFVEAALDVLVDQGYEALTLAKVADKVEYAVGAIYRYFASKDELLVAMQSRVLGTLKGDLGAALQKLDAHLARTRSIDDKQAALMRLMAVPLVHERFSVERPNYFALLSLSIATPRVVVQGEAAQPAFVALLSLNMVIAQLFEEAAAAGALDKGAAPRRAVVLWGAHHGILQLRKLARFKDAPLAAENLSLETIRPLLSGWGADGDEVDTFYARAKKVLEATE